ncbi:MAG: glycosyltransferase [Bacteroidota bacterium]
MLELLSQNELLNQILFIVFSTSVGVLLLYYWLIFIRLAALKSRTKNIPVEGVSVVICAKNEVLNLKKNLPLIFEQDFPKFEVVVVNDESDDDTHFFLLDLQKEHPNLKIVNVKNSVMFFDGKKFPLSIGIKSATYDIILLTDADCYPSTNQWIRTMQQHFTGKTEVVLGYGAYEKKKGFLNKLIRFDTFHIAMQYLSFAKSGIPYMGVGRNLAYRKSLFYRNKGFITHYKISSGDDDLFINQVANSKNTAVEICHDSHTISTPKSTYTDWYYQKKRHLSTSVHYKLIHKTLLSLYPFSIVISYIALIFLLITQYNLYWVISLVSLRILSMMLVFYFNMRKLNEKIFPLVLPFYELLFIKLNVVFYICSFLKKNNKWK